MDACLQPVQLIRGQGILREQEASTPIFVDLFAVQHARQSSAASGHLSIQLMPSLRMIRATFLRSSGRCAMLA